MSQRNVTKSRRSPPTVTYSHADLINAIEAHTTPARTAFYCARLACANGYTNHIDHWLADADQHLERMASALLLRGKTAKARRKALDQAIGEHRRDEAQYRRAVHTRVSRIFGTELTVNLPEEVQAELIDKIEQAADDVLDD